MSAAIEVAERLPELRLVVDHLAKPPVSSGQVESWASAVGQNAAPSQCHMQGVWPRYRGGLVVMDRGGSDSLHGATVDLFGVDRLMRGSDSPVFTLAASYSDVHDVSVRILSDLVGDDLDRVLGGCAIETYRLDL